jgi:hypothetical protein
MRHRLRTAAGRALYRLRQQTVEPVLRIIKEAMGFRRFRLRGQAGVALEWTLVCVAYNLRRLHRLQLAAHGSGPAGGGVVLAGRQWHWPPSLIRMPSLSGFSPQQASTKQKARHKSDRLLGAVVLIAGVVVWRRFRVPHYRGAERLETIREALAHDQDIRIGYWSKRRHRLAHKVITPEALRGELLQAFDPENRVSRLFKVSRIKHVSLVTAPVPIRQGSEWSAAGLILAGSLALASW